MLKVKVWYEGKSGDVELGTVEIGNITRSYGRVSSDHIWRVRGQDSNKNKIDASGYYVDSYNGSALGLLAEIMAEWKSGREHPVDNHGMVREFPEGIDITAQELWNRIDKSIKEES